MDKTFIGYNPYAQFIQRLMVSNPTQAVLEQNRPVSFRVAQAAVPFTNTPQRASSTFVRNIRFLPQSQIAFVKLGNNQYWYGMTPRQLAQWLNSRSLGQYYQQYIKLK